MTMLNEGLWVARIKFIVASPVQYGIWGDFQILMKKLHT